MKDQVLEPIEDDRWAAVLQRDGSADGQFYYAVKSTGIYCRPSCPSRRPAQSQVSFWPTAEAAENAGFRPCLRCRPREQHMQQEIVARVCRYIVQCLDTPMPLPELAKVAGLSASHLQRMFKTVMGVSPREYIQSQRLLALKQRLLAGESVTGAAFDVGLQSTSRLTELADHGLGMSPSEYRGGGRSRTIAYTTSRCSLGYLLVAATDRGVCAVTLGDDPDTLTASLQAEFPAATVQEENDLLRTAVPEIIAYLEGTPSPLSLPLDVQATAFQHRVWQALRAIPYGATRTYEDIAHAIERPSAVRAVARACATNPVALVVPCHRVLRKDGSLSGYRWGVDRKRKLLATEQLKVESGKWKVESGKLFTRGWSIHGRNRHKVWFLTS